MAGGRGYNAANVLIFRDNADFSISIFYLYIINICGENLLDH